MKKWLLAALFLFPLLTNAQSVAFSTDLHYGSTGQDVIALQEFLIDQRMLKIPTATGNFYSLTLTAVKAFQKAEGIVPISGYVGPITRGVINQLLTVQAPDSEGDATITQPIINLIPSVQVQPQIQSQPVLQNQPSTEQSPLAPPIAGSTQLDTDTTSSCTLIITSISDKNTVSVAWITKNATKGTVYYFNGTIAAGIKQYDKLVDMTPIASSSFKGASPNDFKAVVQPGNVTCYASSN